MRAGLWVTASTGLVALAVPATANARTAPSSRVVSAVRASEPPQIDGHVTDAVWRLAEPFSDFVQQQPDEGQPATERTDVRVLFDDRAIYISIVCHDAAQKDIVVTQSRRDADLDNSDSVEIVLDTYNDHQNAFIFGTNPLGVEYDGQIAAEGTSGGVGGGSPSEGFGGGGSQRGSLGGFNLNWDGDWLVRASMTDLGWEAELAIPLKTLRYDGGRGRTWGINVRRNIRRKNEQAFLAPIPRAYDIGRISLAADLAGLDLPNRRELRLVPFGVSGFNTDNTVAADRTDALHAAGADLKWGVTPNLTLDATINTDFAQVEADEEQVNLTRFDLFFPEKRAFFLENAATFQFGQPQSTDLFFSRRIGLSRSGRPIGIVGGGRLSGKVGAYQLGVLNMQTERTTDARSGALVAPANNFTVARVLHEVGRSTLGGVFVGRVATSDAPESERYNRAYGLDANVSVGGNARLFAFLARTDAPGANGSDYAGRAFYNFKNDLWEVNGGFAQVGERFNADVGFVPRVGYRKIEYRAAFKPEPTGLAWIRRFNPHVTAQRYYGFDGRLQTASSHNDFEVQLANGGQAGFRLDRKSDGPATPFTIFSDRRGRTVVIPPAVYTWNEWIANVESDPSAVLFVVGEGGAGSFYDGRFKRATFDAGVRVGARLLAALGYTRNDITLPVGSFDTNVARAKINYSFTNDVLLQALVQYNSQSAVASSNVRFAWLTRSGTGLFVVYNDRRDTFDRASIDVLGRSFVVKYTRFLSF